MQYTVNQLYELFYQKINDVHDIFKGFFGEEYVDLQGALRAEQCKRRIKTFIQRRCDLTDEDLENGCEIPDDIIENLKRSFEDKKASIYVWWPRVKVINEYNKFIYIQDLYAKIDICYDGTIPYENSGFLLNRATYSKEQFLSNYMHSHIQKIPKENFSCFMRPCLGRGPIGSTITTLKNEYSEEYWMLFCQELSMYVTVESIEGGPWNRLENVGNNKRDNSHIGYCLERGNRYSFTKLFPVEKLRDFITYYLEHGHLSLSYKNGRYTYGMPYYEYIIDISNAFIDFYNQNLYSRPSNYLYGDLLSSVQVSNGVFYQITEAFSQNMDRYKGQYVLTFKGKRIDLSITDSAKNEATHTTVLNNSLAMYILNNILRIINFRYINEYNNKYRAVQVPSCPYKRVIYL